MLQICASMSSAGGSQNEDLIGYLDDWAWVIDGATGIDDALVDDASIIVARADKPTGKAS